MKMWLRKIMVGVLMLIIFCGIVGLVFVNFYHERIYAHMPNIPEWFIPVVSVVVLVGFLWGAFRAYRSYELMRSEFTAIVTHAFRTPLARIKWSTENLRTAPPLDETNQMLDTIMIAYNRLLQTVDVLTDLAKSSDENRYIKKATGIHQLIETSVKTYAQEMESREIKLTIDNDIHLPLIILDIKRIQFVMDILLHNAITYTPAGGSISIKTFRDDKHIILQVTDSGAGMSFMEQKKIFQKFYRTDAAKSMYPDGMGLALHISRRIVKHHGGSLTVSSTGREKGSTFTMKLPATKVVATDVSRARG